MACAAAKRELIEQLQKQILAMQGFKASLDNQFSIGLGSIECSFPNNIFPTGAIHEFLSTNAEGAAATLGFMSGLLGRLMQQQGFCLWIGNKRSLFPPALTTFGVDPDRIIFIDLNRPKDLLWAVEEALKCEALSAVVAEVGEVTFTESRRLQLAVEQSKVTGLMHCYSPASAGNTTSVARWKITPLSSSINNNMPGVGYPEWNVELAKVRNGKPGKWQIQWSDGSFQHVLQQKMQEAVLLDKTG